MTKAQQQLVKSSFREVERVGLIVALCFYQKLFELDPSLRRLFHTDIEEQGKKLLQALKIVSDGIDRLPEVLPAIESLGRRHVHYGVKDKDYETVGQALLWTLKESLGANFTGEVGAAWAAAFELMATVMKRAAKSAKCSDKEAHTSLTAQVASRARSS
jgi:hemoglobin-like flavoprotein